MKSNIFKELLESTDDMLSQLEDLISSLDQESYRKPLAILNGASLGEHVRHSLEFFFAYGSKYIRFEIEASRCERNFFQRTHLESPETSTKISCPLKIDNTRKKA